MKPALLIVDLAVRVLQGYPVWEAWWKTDDLIDGLLIMAVVATSLVCVVWWLLEALVEWSKHR